MKIIHLLGLFLIGLNFGFILKTENALFIYFESILIICFYLLFFSQKYLFLFLIALGILWGYENYGFLFLALAYIETKVRENKYAFEKGKYILVTFGQLVGFKLNNLNLDLKKENFIFALLLCIISLTLLFLKEKRINLKISSIHSILAAFVIGFIQVGIFIVIIDFVRSKYRVLLYEEIYSMGLMALILGVIIFSLLGLKIRKEKILWFCSLLSAFACVYIYFGYGPFSAIALMLLLILSGILYPLTINLLNESLESKLILICNSLGALSVIVFKNIIGIGLFVFCFMYLFYLGFKNYKNILNKKYLESNKGFRYRN